MVTIEDIFFDTDKLESGAIKVLLTKMECEAELEIAIDYGVTLSTMARRSGDRFSSVSS